MAASLKLLSDDRRPTADERTALAHFDQAQRQCHAGIDKVLDAAPRGGDPRYELLASLYAGEITYGAFNRRQAELTREIIAD